jgi:8-oxo-dGTP pyrophosphatase MutT (NUDIX family)
LITPCNTSTLLRMKILRDEIVYDGQYIQMVLRYFLDSKGKEKVWEMVRRKVLGEAAVVAAITTEKELVLNKSFRIPTQRSMIELPAGLMDIPGEDCETTAHRELLEETGYAAQTLELLMQVPLDQGLHPNRVQLYLGINARKVAEPKPDDAEHIEVITVPTKDIFSFVKSSQKKFDIDIKILALLPFLEERHLR